MSGGTQTTSQSSTSQPWEAAQPALKQSIGSAQSLASSGAFQPYMGSTVTPWSSQTSQGLKGMQDLAYNNAGTGSLGGKNQWVIDNWGFAPSQRDAMTGLNQARSNVSDIAAGSMLNREDPNFERALSAASESAANQINLGASGAGRYGSAIHQGNVAREVGNYEAGQRVNQYNTERQNQMAANSMMMGVDQALFNGGQQAFSNMGQAYQQAQAPWQDFLQVGGYGEDLATRLKNDEIRRFEAQQAAPRQNIEWLNAIASGAGSLGGTSTATAEQPGRSPLATALGYGTGLASIFGG